MVASLSVLAFAAILTSCASIKVDCGKNEEISVEDEVKIHYSEGLRKSRKALECRWTLVGHSSLTVELNVKDIAQIKLSGESVACESNDLVNRVRCEDSAVIYESESNIVRLSYVPRNSEGEEFRARVWNKCPRFWEACDANQTGRYVSEDSVLVYRLNALKDTEELLPSQKARTDLAGQHVHGELILEMITFGNSSWTTVCQSCDGIALPSSEIPSCHFGHISKCTWIVDKGDISYTRFSNLKVYESKSSGVLKTATTDLEVDSVCMYLEHLVLSDKARIQLNATFGSEHRKITEFDVSKPIWDVTKLELDVSNELKTVKVRFYFNIVGSVLIRKIYGCAKDRPENRVELLRNPRYLGAVYTFEGERLSKSNGCLNGGKFDSIRNQCVCPGGFAGVRCERSCGSNRFGPNCEAECSNGPQGCKGTAFCKRGLGCICAPGFKGLYCSIRCHTTEYGPGCSQTCGRCAGLRGCDPYTGICHKGCSGGYVPPFCQHTFTRFTAVPDVLISYRNVTVNANSKNLKGEGDPKYFQLQVRAKTSDKHWSDWDKTRQYDWPKSYRFSVSVQNLNPGTTYEARLVILTSDLNKYEGGLVPSTIFTTLCDSVYNLKVVETKSTQNSVWLRWANQSKNRTVCPPATTIVEIFLDRKWVVYAVKSDNLNVTSLRPGTVHRVRLRALKITNGVSDWVKIETKPHIEGLVEELKALSVNETSAVVQWKKISGAQWTSFNVSFQCCLLLANESEPCDNDSGWHESENTSAVLQSLKPFRKYRLSVREMPGADSSELTFITKDSLPEVRPVLLSNVTNSTEFHVHVSFPKSATLLNGKLKYLYYSLSRGGVEVARNRTGALHLRFYNLKPTTRYQLKVYIMNHLGYNVDYPLVVETVTGPALFTWSGSKP